MGGAGFRCNYLTKLISKEVYQDEYASMLQQEIEKKLTNVHTELLSF